MKRSKKYEEAAKKVDRNKIYSPIEAATLAKETTTVKYDATIECAMLLGVDPKKADQARLHAFLYSQLAKTLMQLVLQVQTLSVQTN
ncbi:MAG: ribosomal protein [Actinomycetota bacterium]